MTDSPHYATRPADTPASQRPQSTWRRRTMLGWLPALAASALVFAASASAAFDSAKEPAWLGTWTASPQAPEPPLIAAVPAQFDNQTIRQIVHTSVGGTVVRVRLSNEYGTTPLVVGAAHIGRQSTGSPSSVMAGSERRLTFGGRASVTIPPGAPAISDPVALDFPALSNLAISLYLPKAVPVGSFHSLGVQTTFISSQGDHSADADLPVASTTTSWFFLSGVSVAATPAGRAIVALGDSITDGYASTVDKHQRWPNLLAKRIQATSNLRRTAVLDHGISGNRVLHDFIGPNALARFDRDVLAAPAVRFVVVLEGINDIGLPGAFGLTDEVVTADDIIAGYRQLIARAHARHLKIYGGTLTPFEGTTIAGYYTAAGEATRQAVNAWIRSSGEYDAVIDFDLAIRDPAQPGRMLPAYDSGDHLHPNDAGYQAMANSIDLSLFQVD